MSKHIAGDTCPSCDDKLNQADPAIVPWFRWVKSIYKDAHISWSFRDEASQDQAFLEKKSKLQWPNSAHNAMVDGKPASKALDLFQLSTQGNAIFNPGWFRAISEASTQAGFKMLWGGTFVSLGDSDHFQISKK